MTGHIALASPFTESQLEVLKALGALPEGKWATPAEGWFSAEAATELLDMENSPLRGLATRSGGTAYRLSWRGREFVERLDTAADELNEGELN